MDISYQLMALRVGVNPIRLKVFRWRPAVAIGPVKDFVGGNHVDSMLFGSLDEMIAPHFVSVAL